MTYTADLAAALARDLNEFEQSVKRLAAKMNSEWGIDEGDLVRMAGEAVYSYFDGLWEIREITDYPPPE